MTDFYASKKASKSAASIGIVDGSDVAAVLTANDAAIRSMIARHGRFEIVFNGGTLDWLSTYTAPQGLDFSATEETLINVGNVTVMLEGGAGTRGHIIGGDFIFDGNDNVGDSIIDMQANNAHLVCDGPDFINTGADLDSIGPLVFRMGTADKCQLLNMKATNTGTFARWDGNKASLNSKGSVQRNTELYDPCDTANVFYGNYYLEDFTLENPKQNAYSTGAQGGHCIQTRGETFEAPNPTLKNIRIINPMFTGRPGVGYKSGIRKGATGDMIVLRGVDGWDISGGRISDGGEYGGDTVHGTKNGRWHGTLIERMDGSGLIMGTSLERAVSADPNDGTTPVSAVESNVYEGITIVDCGNDAEGVPADALGFSAVSGINVKNVTSGAVIGCNIIRSRGAGLHISNLANQSVLSFYHEGNNYEDNGTQLLGYDAVWSGQTSSFNHDGSVLSAPTSSANNQTWEGVGRGVASVNGDGGLDAYRQKEVDQTPWTISCKVDIDRTASAYELRVSAGVAAGWYKGYFEEFPIAAQSAISLQHIRAGGQINGATTVINANNYEPDADGVLVDLSTAGAETTRSQLMRLFYEPDSGKWFLQYGQKAHITVNDGVIYTPANEDVLSIHADDRIFVGTLVVKESAPNFNTVDNAVWVPRPAAAGTVGPAGADGSTTQLLLASVQTASFTAVSGYRYPIDLSGAADPSNITITLPPDAEGNRFAFYDQTASCSESVTATLTGLIEGVSSTALLLDVAGVKVDMQYEDSIYGYSVGLR